MNLLPYLVILIYALAVIGVIQAIYAFVKKPDWPTFRRSGVTMAGFAWINMLFVFVAFESIFNFVSLVADLSLIWSVTIYIASLVLVYFVTKKLLQGDKFNYEKYVLLVLVPLSIPGITLISRLAKAGSIGVYTPIKWIAIPYFN